MAGNSTTGCEWMSGDRHIIFGGGPPLPGSPRSWDEAQAWAETANKDSTLTWTWDCHFKLDYDGDLVRISSRFYPPAKYYGPRWNGEVALMFGDEDVIRTKFDAESLDELKEQVETYVAKLVSRVRSVIRLLALREGQ